MTIANPLGALFVFDRCLQMGFHHMLDAAVDGQEKVIILFSERFRVSPPVG